MSQEGRNSIFEINFTAPGDAPAPEEEPSGAESRPSEAVAHQEGRASEDLPAGFPVVRERSLRAMAGPRAYERGRHMTDRVRDVAWDEDARALSGVVSGSRDYRTTLTVSKRRGVQASCTCVVGRNCKHGVALALHATGKGVPQGRPDARPRAHEELLKWLTGLEHDERTDVLRELLTDPAVRAGVARLRARRDVPTRESLLEAAQHAGRREAAPAERARFAEDLRKWCSDHGSDVVPDVWVRVASWRRSYRSDVAKDLYQLVDTSRVPELLTKHWISPPWEHLGSALVDDLVDLSYAQRKRESGAQQLVEAWAQHEGLDEELERLRADSSTAGTVQRPQVESL